MISRCQQRRQRTSTPCIHLWGTEEVGGGFRCPKVSRRAPRAHGEQTVPATYTRAHRGPRAGTGDPGSAVSGPAGSPLDAIGSAGAHAGPHAHGAASCSQDVPPSLVSPACAGQPLAPALKFTAAQTEKDGVGQSVRVPGGSPSRVIFMDGREVVSTCSRRLRGGHRAWWAARGTLLCCRSLPSVGVSVTIREVRTERRDGWVPRGTRFFP